MQNKQATKSALTLTVFAFVILTQTKAHAVIEDFKPPLYEVAVEKNIVYGQGAVNSPEPGMKDLLLDVYSPIGARGPLPV